jgi:hypothetical protein
MKTCPACGDDKASEDSGRNRTLPDGLSFYCREGNRHRSREWYRRAREEQGTKVRDHSWVPDGFRWCPTCEQAVAHADYVRSGSKASGFGSQCKACHRQASNASCWSRRYGLTKAEVEHLRDSQSDRCAICGTS